MAASRTYLVTGARAPATLEAIRRLGRAGHDVLAADSVHVPLGRFSRFVRRYYRVPGPRQNPAGFIGALHRIISEEKVDVLLPTCEEIYHLSRRRKALDNDCEIFCPTFDVLEALHHKGRFAQFTHQLGHAVTAPESVIVKDTSQLQALGQHSQEWVFKPVYSRFATRTLIRPSAAQISSMTLDGKNPWLAQRFVAGRELSSYSIAVRGRLTGHTSYHSRHRAGQAAGIYFAPECHPIIFDFIERLVKHLDYTGQIAFDFIECAETGRVFVLECNPRLTSGVHLLSPDFDLDAALRGDVEAILDPVGTKRSKMLSPVMLLTGLSQAIRAGRLSKWRHDFSHADDVVFTKDDRFPALGQFLFLIEMGILGCWRRTGMIAATTADIEWNG